jgi:tetratricopeptide (TPR) repeat protein
MALALSQPGGLDPRAAAFLEKQGHLVEKQGRLADLQIARIEAQDDHIAEEQRLQLSHLRLRKFTDYSKITLEIAIGLFLLVVVGGFAAMVWSAAHDNGLVIEAFSVPPEFNQQGLTGQVIASKVLDRLSSFQDQTLSNRAVSSYANNWGNDIKIQIPNTGVSMGELNRSLREWLGHETHISGEIYRTASGIAVTARAGGETSPTFAGTETELDSLIEKAAEAVYRSTQPYRYAIYLNQHDRPTEAKAVFELLSKEGPALERAWAFVGLGFLAANAGDLQASIRLNRQAIVVKPDIVLAYDNLAFDEADLRHEEAELAARIAALAVVDRATDISINKENAELVAWGERSSIAFLQGDYRAQFLNAAEIEARPDRNDSWDRARSDKMEACALTHDLACFAAAWAEFVPTTDPLELLFRQRQLQFGHLALGHWKEVVGTSEETLAIVGRVGSFGALSVVRFVNPATALAAANLGDFGKAHALVDTSPPDCSFCLRARGNIDALERNWHGAEYWFARAVHDAPSIPFAYADWGAMLLHRGEYDAAIAKLILTNEKGPHFADPLEMWGEALILKNRSDLALAKFEDANKYARNWSRLHVKWGEALSYVGRKDDAHTQYRIALTLDLNEADRAELTRDMIH